MNRAVIAAGIGLSIIAVGGPSIPGLESVWARIVLAGIMLGVALIGGAE